MRKIKGLVGLAIGLWAMAASSFHLYTSGFGFLAPYEQRALHLMWFLPLAYLLFPARRGKSPQHRPSVFDWIFAFASTLPNLYVLFEADRIYLRIENIDPLLREEWIFGIMIVVLLLEGVRRAVTPALTIVASVLLCYLFLTEYMPGMLYFRDLPMELIVETMYIVGGQGVFGFVTGVSATMVAIFIVFGAFMDGTGTGRLFSNIGTKFAGRYVGGPAKVAVVSSALMGTMSGSSSANVVTTGTFTIPLMKNMGYRAEFAGGVEAASSVGGQIMSPIMGAAAFIMAETTQTPYQDIIVAALLGAICYFFMVFVTVHFEALKLGLRGMKSSEIPTWGEIAKDIHLLIPVAVLVGLLVFKFSPHFSAFWSIVASFIVSWFRKHTRLTPAKLLAVLETGGRSVVPVALACTCANIVVAALTVTGLSVSAGSMIMTLSGGNLLLAGFLLMFCTILLGMGVPTSAAYVITASVGAPVLIQLGVEMLAAHLFVLYFAVLADATPPVSVASYAAASIAKSNPIVTGAQAFRLALAGFIVAYSYLFTPALIMQGSVISIIAQLLLNFAGLTIISSVFTGYFRGRLNATARLLFGVSALVLVLFEAVEVWPRIAALTAMIGVLYWSPEMILSTRKAAPSAE
jgi:TRAP transporter 4TM/12TM fusion protein